MTLIEYIRACVAAPATKTPAKVVIDDALVLPLRNLRGQSESKVLEHGHNLFWRSDNLVLSDRMVGQATRISLDTSHAITDHAYIGDIHSHPYKIKMGKSARIGPSCDDLDEWYKSKPAHLPLGVHLVMSSASVFLVVTRNPGSKAKVDYSGAEPDTARLNNYARTIPALADGLGRAQSMNAKQRWQFEREIWETMAPDAAANFAQDNRDMNVAIANHSKHEFYHCADIEASRELVRLSSAVH